MLARTDLPRDRRPMDRPDASLFARWRFLTLTLLICAWLLLAPMLTADWRVQLLLEGFLAVTVMFTVWANPHWKRLRNALIALWLLSLTGTLLSILTADAAWRWSRTLELLTLVPLMALLAAGILAFVLRERTLTLDSIFATVAAYLLVAVMFAQIYLCLLAWRPDSFSMPVEVASRPMHLLQADITYFSLVTLATVGYGDILPATPTARTLAMIEAVSGQFYIAIVVALFVGMYSSQRRG
jgi:hypothetical protein